MSTLKEVAFWRFDDKGAVLYYDAWIPNLAAWISKFLGVDVTSPVVDVLAVLAGLCPEIQARCKDYPVYLE